MNDWDPDDGSRPLWMATEVVTILDGESFTEAPHRNVRGKRTGINYMVRTFRFACGCVASDDVGWQSCGRGLHRALASSPRNSRFAETFRAKRKIFDQLLAEAWRRRGSTNPDHYYEYHEAKSHEPFLTFQDWQLTHDLGGANVWKDGDLRADLDSVPGAARLRLSSSGTGPGQRPVLTFDDGRRADREIASGWGDAVTAIFGGFADRS
jgi:hypothetical protein